MDLGVFAELMSGIISHSLVAPGRLLKWTIIANPTAGGFTIRSRWKKHYKILQDYTKRSLELPIRRGSVSDTAKELDQGSGKQGDFGLILTTGPGYGGKITEKLIDEIASEAGKAFHLLITAGGDGTSLEVQNALFHAPAGVLSNCVILRLPMGTGNDGSDGWELSGSLDRLIKPVKIERQRALRLETSTPGKGPFLAFNILSVGIDAFITHMTNKMKGNLPGDSYKLWVDIASLFYDSIYKVGVLDVTAKDEKGRVVKTVREKLLLLAVGVSGHRTYGSHKKILPDDRNVCVLKQMSVFRKLKLKGLFATGTHTDKPESILWNASRVEFSGLYPILAQMDGETVLLRKPDFPAVIELTEPLIPILSAI
jgi:diacylglycerol kinase family enzyme